MCACICVSAGPSTLAWRMRHSPNSATLSLNRNCDVGLAGQATVLKRRSTHASLLSSSRRALWQSSQVHFGRLGGSPADLSSATREKNQQLCAEQRRGPSPADAIGACVMMSGAFQRAGPRRARHRPVPSGGRGGRASASHVWFFCSSRARGTLYAAEGCTRPLSSRIARDTRRASHAETRRRISRGREAV